MSAVSTSAVSSPVRWKMKEFSSVNWAPSQAMEFFSGFKVRASPLNSVLAARQFKTGVKAVRREGVAIAMI